MANHSSILALRAPWRVWKGKNIWHQEMSCQVGMCPICYWGRAEKQLLKKWRGLAKAKTALRCGCVWCKVSCCKEPYCIVTWSVRSMNQGELHAGKQEMARVNINILAIRELKWDNWVAYKMGKSLWLFNCTRKTACVVYLYRVTRYWKAVAFNLVTAKLLTMTGEDKSSQFAELYSVYQVWK